MKNIAYETKRNDRVRCMEYFIKIFNYSYG